MRRAAIIFVIGLHAVLLARVSLASPDCEYLYSCSVGVTGDGDGFTTDIVYRSDGSEVNISPGGNPGTTYEYQLAPACGPNINGGDASCNAAFACPNEGDYRYFVFYREVSPTPGSWTRGQDECLSSTPLTPPQHYDVDPVVSEYIKTMPVSSSPILYEPGTGAVVNAPLIVRTSNEPKTGTTTAFGLTVTVTATPHWHWDFGDGTGLDTFDPGRAYDGIDPREQPDHYIAHTYRHPGARRITLQTIWTATYTRSDQPGSTHAVSDTVTKESTRTVPVTEYEGRVTQ